MDISWQGRYTDNLHISDEQRTTDFVSRHREVQRL